MRLVAVALLVSLAAPARADDNGDDDPDFDVLRDPRGVRDAPGASLLGMRISFGTLPVSDGHRIAYSICLNAGASILRGWHLSGELEMMWLEQSGQVAMDVHGFGARGQLAIRHALATWRVLYLDAELGGGGALFDDTKLGRQVQPDGFVGLRFGYDLVAPRAVASKLFEAELDVRAIAVPEGIGWMAGVGMAWN